MRSQMEFGNEGQEHKLLDHFFRHVFLLKRKALA
jgi:hypothetical protein